MSRTAVQIPGDATPTADVSLPALNNADADPDRVAAEREALTQSRAASAAVERGDLAGAQKILADAQAAIAAASVPEVYVESHSVDLSQFGEGVMAVSVPVVRRSAIVEKFGHELPWPEGTPLNENKQPCAGGETVHFVVGRLLTPAGWVIGRACLLSAPGA